MSISNTSEGRMGMKINAWNVIHAFETPITSVSNVFLCIVGVLGSGACIPFSRPADVNRS